MIYRVKNMIPTASEVVHAAEPAHTFAITVHAIRADAAGTLEARLRGDSGFRTYTVAAGDVVLGEFAEAKLGAFSDGEILGLAFPVA